MLRTLSVSHYVLIDSLEISFPEGLIIITGQTGAGKSILIGALSLLMGAKADASAISGGSDSCVVEAVFEGVEADGAKAILDDEDVEWDDGRIVIRRVVHRSGRSRAFVNDCPVSVQTLNALSAFLVDIHSQHQSLLLKDRTFHLGVLDLHAGDLSLLAACKKAYEANAKVTAEYRDVCARLAELSQSKDYNASQFRQLEAAALKEGELEELESEQRRLANAEQIKEDLCRVETAFAPLTDDIPDTEAQMRTSAQLLSRLSAFLPQAASLSERLTSVRIEFSDILSEVRAANERLEVSQERLSEVESRMSLLYDLMSKHSCRTVGELIAVRERFGEALFDSSSLEQRKADLEAALAQASSHLAEAADALHKARVAAIPSLCSEVKGMLSFLELDKAAFDVDVRRAALTASGYDDVTLLFSATGQNPVDVSKCASGGEMSRIMLSLKALMARHAQMPTMIFDEIDSGVSGSVADAMGSMICRMGEDMQVFAITHLPQVAAKGSAHYLVSKETDAQGRSVSTIRLLSRDERVQEVARMLSGSVVTAAAVANAQSLLGESL